MRARLSARVSKRWLCFRVAHRESELIAKRIRNAQSPAVCLKGGAGAAGEDCAASCAGGGGCLAGAALRAAAGHFQDVASPIELKSTAIEEQLFQLSPRSLNA